jgi:hypothetical protein
MAINRMEREVVYILCDLHGFDLLKFEASLKSQFLLLLLEFRILFCLSRAPDDFKYLASIYSI